MQSGTQSAMPPHERSLSPLGAPARHQRGTAASGALSQARATAHVRRCRIDIAAAPISHTQKTAASLCFPCAVTTSTSPRKVGCIALHSKINELAAVP
jgi:hypothetical protein